MIKKLKTVISLILITLSLSPYALAGKDEAFEFGYCSFETKTTPWAKKETAKSIFLDLTGSDFKTHGVIYLKIEGKNSKGEIRNCTYASLDEKKDLSLEEAEDRRYYLLESNKKYELLNIIKENSCTEVRLSFRCMGTDHCIKGVWNPDYNPSKRDPNCFLIGNSGKKPETEKEPNKKLVPHDKRRDGNTDDKKIENLVISKDGRCFTEFGTKTNSSSVYLNLEKSTSGKTVRVTVMGLHNYCSENCTCVVESYEFPLGQKGQLSNIVKEGKFLNGKWIITKNKTGVYLFF